MHVYMCMLCVVYVHVSMYAYTTIHMHTHACIQRYMHTSPCKLCTTTSKFIEACMIFESALNTDIIV